MRIHSRGEKILMISVIFILIIGMIFLNSFFSKDFHDQPYDRRSYYSPRNNTVNYKIVKHYDLWGDSPSYRSNYASNSIFHMNPPHHSRFEHTGTKQAYPSRVLKPVSSYSTNVVNNGTTQVYPSQVLKPVYSNNNVGNTGTKQVYPSKVYPSQVYRSSPPSRVTTPIISSASANPSKIIRPRS